MKDKFKKAIKSNFFDNGSPNYYGAEKAAEICNTLHQQAMKDERKKLIKKIKEAKKYYQGIGRYNYSAGFEKAIYLIAKENNIEL